MGKEKLVFNKVVEEIYTKLEENNADMRKAIINKKSHDVRLYAERFMSLSFRLFKEQGVDPYIRY